MNQIKIVYKQLLKQIHPDFFHDNKIAKEANREMIGYIHKWVEKETANENSTDKNDKVQIERKSFPSKILSIYFKTDNMNSNKPLAGTKIYPEICIKELKSLAESVGISLKLDYKRDDIILASKSKYLGPLVFWAFAKNYSNQQAMGKENDWNQNVTEITNAILDEIKKEATFTNKSLSQKHKLRELRNKEKNNATTIQPKKEDFESLLRDSIHSHTNYLLSKQNSGLSCKNTTNNSILLNRSNIYFDSKVNPKKWPYILNKLENRLDYLNYQNWYNLPIMIVNTWDSVVSSSGIWHYPGFVTIPIEASPEDLKTFLNLNLPDIKNRRMAINLKTLNSKPSQP